MVQVTLYEPVPYSGIGAVVLVCLATVIFWLVAFLLWGKETPSEEHTTSNISSTVTVTVAVPVPIEQ